MFEGRTPRKAKVHREDCLLEIWVMFADVALHKLGKLYGLTGFRVFACLREGFGGHSVQFVRLAYETLLF
jgi:hypothetical protein